MKKRLICFIAVVLSVLIPLQNIALAKTDYVDFKSKKTVLVKYKNTQNKYMAASSGIKSQDLNIKKNLRNNRLKVVEATDDAIDKLKKDDNVILVEEDSPVRKSDDEITWNIEKVKAPVLQKQNYSGKGVKVAVFDTGIDTQNSDLNVAGGISFVEGTSGYSDDNGHGTAMASILASLKNDKGYLGVAPEIELYSVKVLDKNGDGKYSSIIDGLQWAIDNNINIVTMSFGGQRYSKILQEAINEAYAHNILIIAASGNNGDTEKIDFPARYKNVISVGAVDKNNDIASFTNRGKQLDIVAPGVAIETMGLKSDNQKISGTSVAVPHVAGIAAEIWGAKKTTTNSQIRNILLGSANPLGEHNTYGYGLVNGEEALNNIDKIFDIPEKAEVTDSDSNGSNGDVHISSEKYYGDNQHIKLGQKAVIGMQYSASHDNIQVTVKFGSKVVKTEVISVFGEDPMNYVQEYSCDSSVLNKVGTYTITLVCPEYPRPEIFTIYVEENDGSPQEPTEPTDPTVEKPDVPSGVSLTPHTSYIIVNWRNVENADEYNVMVDGDSLSTAIKSPGVTGSLSPNSYHKIRVRAVNAGGESDWTSDKGVYTLAAIPVERDGNLDTKKLSLTVSWQDNGNPSGTPYKLALFDENGNMVKERAWTTNLSDTITGLGYCKTYIVKIKAKNFADVETEWYQFGTVTVPPKTQCDKDVMEEQYGYHSRDQIFNGDPVNTITGNFYTKDVDLYIQEIGIPLQIQRSYNSVDSKVGIMGKSWRMNYESSISVDSSTGNVIVNYSDGHVGRFVAKTGSNEFISPQGIFEQLKKDNDGLYSLLFRDKSVFKYNSAGKLISISDKNGNAITLTYDNYGQINTITGQGGRKLTFTSENGKLKKITDPENRVTTYSYDAAGNLIKVKGSGGGEKNYTYNNYGLTSVSDENNKKYVENEYDKFNRIIKQYDEYRNEITYTYDDYAQETICHYSASNITEKYKFNDKLYVNKITYSDNTYEEYTFDQWGNKDSIRDRNGNITAYEYDQHGNLRTMISPAPYSYKTVYNYDENDNIKEIITAGGAYTIFTYDTKGNVKQIMKRIDDAASAVTTYDYDNQGRVLNATDAENNITRYEYDNSPNPVKVIGPENETTYYTYDNLNRRITSSNEAGKITYIYNDKDKVEKVIDQNNNITRYKYDKVGNLIKMIKPEQYNAATDDGIGVTYQYDAMDRPVKEINALGGVKAIKYDEFGNIAKEINPNYFTSSSNDGIGLEYVYDSNKRLVKIINPSGKASRILYDSVGNMIKQIDANNYNPANDNGPGMEYTYDELNRLSIVKDAFGNVVKKLVYDANGHIIKEIDAKGYLSGNNDETRYGTVMKYNSAGWLTEQRKPVIRGNGVIYYQIIRYLYNKNGQIIENKTSQEYVTLTGEPSRWNTITYEYNKSGKPLKISDSVGGLLEYRYNSLGEVEEESSVVNEQQTNKVCYTYNKLGQVDSIKREILSKDIINGDNSGTTFAVTSLEYDKNGNIISSTRPEGYKTYYEYDSMGRLKTKKEEVTSGQITEYNTSVSINTTKAAVFPGELVEYQLKITPDRDVTGLDITIEYDDRICDLVDTVQQVEGISVRSEKPGEIRITGSISKISTETVLSLLNFKMKEGVSGKGYITIDSLSTYTDSNGDAHEFSEGSGKIMSGKTLDMNDDGKVETNDFTLMAKKEGISSNDLKYEDKYDIDGDGKIDALDLNYIKDYLFSSNQNASNLSVIEQAKFYEKFTNAVYSEEVKDGIRETSYEYDKVGNIIKERYANGTIEYKYDAYNRIITVKDKGNNESRVFYDEVGNITKEVTPGCYNAASDDGPGTQYIYDKMNRLIEVKDAYGNVIKRSVYDVNGLVTKTIDAVGYLSGSNDSERYGIEYTYDIGNRIETIITPEAKDENKASSVYAYDAAGNVTSYTDGEQNTTLYSYDMWGKPAKVTDPYGVVTAYSYDNAGNLVSVVDGNNNKTTYVFNSLNKISEMIDPLRQKVLYKYDKDGRTRQQIDRNGNTINYDYNSDDNVTNMSILGREEQNKFLYNSDGNLIAAITATGVDTFSYNLNNQVLNKSRNGREVLKYNYDKNGNVLGVVDPTGKSTQYTYDYNNNLKTVGNGNDILATYGYNIDQTISSIEYKNGIDISYNYDKDKNVMSLSQLDSDGKEINSFGYTYDNNGNQLSKTENGSTINYTYDKLNRLLTSGTDSFAYDNTGNRKTWNKQNEAVTYSYDKNNRLTSLTISKTGSIVYTYDKNGNQLTSSNGDKYTYDGFNQLKSVTLANGQWMENEYDAFGLRVAVYENGTRSAFTYDRGNIITEENGSGNLVSRSIRGTQIVAKENSVDLISYYLNNAHGDVSKIVNENGEVLNSYEYDTFGNTTSSTEKVQNRFQYAGEQLDKVTGQYYLRARFYDPALGRFVTEDTYRGQLNDTMSLNLYSYCSNNPVNLIDPSGHEHYKEFNGDYTWLPDGASRTAEKIVFEIIPFGSLILAGIDYIQYNDINTSKGELALSTGLSVVSLGVSSLVNAGKIGVKSYFVIKETASYIDKLTKIKTAEELFENQAGGLTLKDQYKGKYTIEKYTRDEILYDIIEKAHLGKWLTASSKSIIKQRVDFIMEYITANASTFSYDKLERAFAGYFNKDGKFITGYIQKTEGMEIPQPEWHQTSYDVDLNRHSTMSLTYPSDEYINDFWVDSIITESFRNIMTGEGYSITDYYKNGKKAKPSEKTLYPKKCNMTPYSNY
jgi:RHS repeat-associated protein